MAVKTKDVEDPAPASMLDGPASFGPSLDIIILTPIYMC